MNIIYLDRTYHAYLKEIERAAQYLWLSARGLELEPTLYWDAIETCKRALNYTLPESILAQAGDGAPMYEDELDRLQEVIKLLNILMAEYPDLKSGYNTTSHPETFEAMAVQLYGDSDDAEKAEE